MADSVFIPEKEMSFKTVTRDRQRLLEYCKSLESSTMVLDLSKVTLCDSAGLAFLIEAKRLAREFKKSCKIAGMTREVSALVEFCGVQTVLVDIFADEKCSL